MAVTGETKSVNESLYIPIEKCVTFVFEGLNHVFFTSPHSTWGCDEVKPT